MKSSRPWLAATFAASMMLSGSANAFESTSLGEVVVRLGPSPAAPTVVQPPAGFSAMRRTATFNVTYTGFSAAAKTAFQRAVNIWATQINSTVPIKVNASFTNLGNTGILGSAGPVTFLGCSSGCPSGVVANTWYPIPLVNKITGSDQRTDLKDINANFNSTFTDWHFGSGNAPAGKIDFTSVVLHELGHGLGFVGAAAVNGNQGTVRALGSGRPTIYARFVVNDGNVKLITFADPSTNLKNQLTSNKLFFRLKSGTRYRLFAPNPFQSGSSFSHFNEATFPAGNPNSLMTPQIGFAETIRSPGPATLKLFKDMGW